MSKRQVVHEGTSIASDTEAILSSPFFAFLRGTKPSLELCPYSIYMAFASTSFPSKCSHSFVAKHTCNISSLPKVFFIVQNSTYNLADRQFSDNFGVLIS